MEKFVLERSNLGPEIVANLSGDILIKGRSMMENASEFYMPFHDWLDNLLHSKGETLTRYDSKTYMPIAEIVLTIDLEYFNSSSVKQILKLLMKIDESGKSAKVIWTYPIGNDILKERGKELEVMVDFCFEYCEKLA